MTSEADMSNENHESKLNYEIKTIQELSFVVFCVENLAIKLNVDPTLIYKVLSEGNDLLHNYIIAGYDFLHTQDKEYILNDIVEEMQRQGIRL